MMDSESSEIESFLGMDPSRRGVESEDIEVGAFSSESEIEPTAVGKMKEMMLKESISIR
jgi:hypothetical protein